jgi:dTMP kinase
MFIVFEGGEGAGKTTQLARLAVNLRDLGLDVVTTREPGGTPFAEEVRELIMRHGDLSGETEVLLFTAARRDHVEKVIRPALERGAWVLCDRYLHSTLVYQGMRVDPLPIGDLHLSWAGGLYPDLVLLLDVDPLIGLERRRHAGAPNRFDEQTLAFHRKIRERFLSMNLIKIDASADVDHVEADIFQLVGARA